MYFSNDFYPGRTYPHEIAIGLPTRTFQCKCGILVKTVAKNKYQCDSCQLEANREASRRASRRQTKREKEKRASLSARKGKLG